jgi:hypothetical protein
MKFTALLNADVLLGLAMLASDPKDLRAGAIHGVHVELAGGFATCVASNGGVMGAERRGCEYDGPPVRLTIPADTIAMLKGKRGGSVVTLEGDDTAGAYMLRNTVGAYSFAPLSGRFPDWRRIVPVKPSGEFAHFDPTLLVLIGKAAAQIMGARSAKPARVFPNGRTGAALVQTDLGDAAVFVIAPLYEQGDKDEKPPTVPIWAAPGLQPPCDQITA